MQAGHGGIRWNSSTNYIQLMDENKNWINWTRYNPNKRVILCQSYYSVSAPAVGTYTADYSGLYFVFTGRWSDGGQVSTSGQIRYQINQNYNGYTNIIYCERGDTITYNVTISRFSTLVIYCLPEFTNVENVSYVSFANSNARTGQISYLSDSTFNCIFHFERFEQGCEKQVNIIGDSVVTTQNPTNSTNAVYTTLALPDEGTSPSITARGLSGSADYRLGLFGICRVF